MDVNIWKALFHSSRELDVEVSIHIGRQSGLNADFGCAHFRGFADASKNLIHRKQISLFASVCTAERAKPTMLHTNIREVDIPIDDVRNNFTHLAPPQFVRGGNGRLEFDSA